MRGLGLISILLTTALVVWLFSHSGAVKSVDSKSKTEYQQALDSAQEAAESMGF